MGGSSSGSWSRLGDVRALEEKAKAALQSGKRNVFISFATEDMDEVNLLRAQAKNEKMILNSMIIQSESLMIANRQSILNGKSLNVLLVPQLPLSTYLKIQHKANG